MKYRIVSVSFQIDPMDLSEQEVNVTHSLICDDVTSKDWDADSPEHLFELISDVYKYPLASIVFFPMSEVK